MNFLKWKQMCQLKNKKGFVNKLLKLRRGLINRGNSYINNARAFSIIENIKLWMDAYPNVSEQQFTNFMKRNYNELKYLVPGGECKSSKEWIKKLDEFVNV